MSVKLLLICAVFTVAYAQQTLTYYQSGVKKGYTSWYDSWAPGGGCGYNENIYAGYQPSVVLTAAINIGSRLIAVGSTKIHYQIEKGAQNYYFKFLPLYNLRTLAGAWVNQNGAFNSCERQNGYFACQAQGGPFSSNPQIKLKSVDGEEITDNIQITLSSSGTGSIQVVSGQQNVNFSPKNVASPGAIRTSNAMRSVAFNAVLFFLIFFIY